MNIYIPEVEIDCFYLIHITDKPPEVIDEDLVDLIAAAKNVKYLTVTVRSTDEQNGSYNIDVNAIDLRVENDLDVPADSEKPSNQKEVFINSNSQDASRQACKSADTNSSMKDVTNKLQNAAAKLVCSNVQNELPDSCTNSRQPDDQSKVLLNFLDASRLYKITKIGPTNKAVENNLKNVHSNTGDKDSQNEFPTTLNSPNGKKENKTAETGSAKKGRKNKKKNCTLTKLKTGVQKKPRKKRTVFLNQQNKLKSTVIDQNPKMTAPCLISVSSNKQEVSHVSHENMTVMEEPDEVLVTSEDIVNTREQDELLTAEESIISSGEQDVMLTEEEITGESMEENQLAVSESVSNTDKKNELQHVSVNAIDTGLNELLLACESIISSDNRDILQVACKSIESTDEPKELQTAEKKEPSSVEKPFECDICHYRARLKNNLTRHRLLHLPTKSYFCDICGKGFKAQGYLTRHKMIHFEKLFSCGICGKRYTRKSACQDHYRRHIEEQKFYECDICKRKFTKKRTLACHVLTHNAEHPFRCHICQKVFSSDRTLGNHLRLHSGDRPFACDLCLKAFVTKAELGLHFASHGEKKFLCDVCGKGFFHQCYLKDHYRIHTGEKPYVCKICGKSFSRRAAIKKHSYTHSSEKPFACEVCPKKFSDPYNFKKHCLIHVKDLTVSSVQN